MELVSEMMAHCPDEWIFFEVVENEPPMAGVGLLSEVCSIAKSLSFV